MCDPNCNAPDKMPAAPEPDRARPKVKTDEIGAVAHTVELTSKINRAIKNTNLVLKKVKILLYKGYRAMNVRRYAEPYQPTSYGTVSTMAIALSIKAVLRANSLVSWGYSWLSSSSPISLLPSACGGSSLGRLDFWIASMGSSECFSDASPSPLCLLGIIARICRLKSRIVEESTEAQEAVEALSHPLHTFVSRVGKLEQQLEQLLSTRCLDSGPHV